MCSEGVLSSASCLSVCGNTPLSTEETGKNIEEVLVTADDAGALSAGRIHKTSEEMDMC